MKRQPPKVKHPGLIANDAVRWSEFAWTARLYATNGSTTEARLRAMLKSVTACVPLGAGGPLDPCVRLREEVERMLDPPHVPYHLRIGVDMEAMAASNRSEVVRFADEVTARCASVAVVSEAGRRL